MRGNGAWGTLFTRNSGIKRGTLFVRNQKIGLPPGSPHLCPPTCVQHNIILNHDNGQIKVILQITYPLYLFLISYIYCLTSFLSFISSLLLKVSRFRGLKDKHEPNASIWFLEPVSAIDVPDYYDIIKKPMDFSKIKRKLEVS